VLPLLESILGPIIAMALGQELSGWGGRCLGRRGSPGADAELALVGRQGLRRNQEKPPEHQHTPRPRPEK